MQQILTYCINTGKSLEVEHQINAGDRTVLNLVAKYKGTGRNVTLDHFLTSMLVF